MTNPTTRAAGTDDRPPTGDEWAIVARHTVMDGLVLDWYRTTDAYEYEAGMQAWSMSVSRDGVLVGNGVYLHTIPDRHLELARGAHQLLATRRDTDRDLAKAIATHRDDGTGQRPFGRGKLVRIQPEGTAAPAADPDDLLAVLLAAGFTDDDARTSLHTIRDRIGTPPERKLTAHEIRRALATQPDEPYMAVFGTDAARAVTTILHGKAPA